VTSTVSLDEISAFITKGSTPTTYGFKWEATGVPFLRSECVSDHGLDMRQSMFISPAANQALRRSQVVDGDILMTITGNVGRVVRLTGVDQANINQHIARIRVIDPRFDSGFIYHYLSQGVMRGYYESIVTGQAYPQISLVQVRETGIPAVPIAEQKAVAVALSDADDQIVVLERLITKKQAIKQGMMQALLTGRTRLPGFAKPWLKTQLGDVVPFAKGSGLSKSDLRRDGAYMCVHYGELFTRYGAVIEFVHSRTHLHLPVKSQVGDVLMPTSDVTPRGLAKASVIQQSGVGLGGDILIIRPHAGSADGRFIARVIRHGESQVLTLVRGSTVFHLYAADMRGFSIDLPPVEEQAAIAEILADADDELEASRLRLTKAKAVKQGMMQELLTGRTHLPGEEGAA
jgi:type I restriction enzyme S subunit